MVDVHMKRSKYIESKPNQQQSYFVCCSCCSSWCKIEHWH